MGMEHSKCNILQCKSEDVETGQPHRRKDTLCLSFALFPHHPFLLMYFCIRSVAGTIAAIDNGIGVVGVAAGATIVPVKVVDARGKGTMGGVLQGIEWVTQHAKKGDVVNISLGGKINQSVDDAVLRAAKNGLLIALSAGNDSTSASERSPSRTNHRNIFTIAATTQQNELAYFSNLGKPPVDWSAPGVGILSTFKVVDLEERVRTP
jgi:subtilisin family serine protease